MTHEELDALPECEKLALYQPDDEPMMVCDTSGDWWIIGYANGQRWKRKMASVL